MNNTALGAENKKEQTINLWDEQLDLIMNECTANKSMTIRNDIVSFVEIHKVHGLL